MISLISIFATGGLVGRSGGAQALGGMKVNIYNQASHIEVESRPSADGQGLEITILDVVKGGIMAGQFYRPTRQHFGANKFSKWVGVNDSNPFAQALTWFFPTNPSAPSEASNQGLVKVATGGLIRGPGTGRSDSILARLSNGEFVVNAAQTAKHLPLLKAINSGPDLPAFATGGLVGSSSGAQAPGGMKVNIYNQASHIEVESRPSADGQGLEITILDVVKGGIMPGQLDRPMRQHFGASPKPQGG